MKRQEADMKRGIKLIFVVDDSEWHNILLEKILLDCGYAVCTFTDGYSLLASLETEQPHLVISDINMPEINGFELCKKIKSAPAWRDVPVMFLSTMKKDDVDVIGNGAVGFMQKPFDKEPLLNIVAQKV